mmetsp:Transcript_47231/g.145457  ORF Transcript_47231/g.145457 Transcript_47231/m.145457 type:complete len:140 (+) Transcript_47231:31-450(+)
MRKLAFVVFLATMLPMRGIRSLVRTGSWAQLRGLRSLLGIAVLFLARIAARRRFEEEEEEEGWAQDARRWLEHVRQKEVSFAHPALLRRNSLRRNSRKLTLPPIDETQLDTAPPRVAEPPPPPWLTGRPAEGVRRRGAP